MSKKQDEIKTIEINGVKYVQGGSTPDVNTDGLQYVIVRSRDQGVMCGYLAGYEGRVVRLLLARQMWRYDSRFVLPDLAEFGPRDASKCKFSAAVTSGETLMLEACGIIPCTSAGGEALRAVPAQDKR
jgi:hypothetical protein